MYHRPKWMQRLELVVHLLENNPAFLYLEIQHFMEVKSCYFIGHREVDERLLSKLKLVINRLVQEENVRYFYVGGYGGFERLPAASIKRLNQKSLFCYITSLNASQRFPAGLMGRTIRKVLRTLQEGKQLCEPTGSWSIPVVGLKTSGSMRQNKETRSQSCPIKQAADL